MFNESTFNFNTGGLLLPLAQWQALNDIPSKYETSAQCCAIGPASTTLNKYCANPANPIHLGNVGLKFGEQRRRWPNINPILAKRIAFVGEVLCSQGAFIISGKFPIQVMLTF